MNLKTRQELIDYDYLDKLSPKEKEWLNKFTAEYVNADLDRKNFNNNIHNTLELKQDCDRRNNVRKKDLYTNLKVINMIDDWEDYKSRVSKQEELIELLDEFNDSDNDTSKNADSTDEQSDES